MTSNKARSAAFAAEVVLAFHAAGFTSAVKAPEPKGLDPAERVRGSVLGLPITISTRSRQTLDLSGAMDEARREAQAEGRDLYVSIQRRRSHTVKDAYCTLPLSALLRVLARLHPELLSEQAAGGEISVPGSARAPSQSAHLLVVEPGAEMSASAGSRSAHP